MSWRPRGEESSRVARSGPWVAALVVTLLLAGAAVGVVQGSAWFHRLQAVKAWEVRRGDVLVAEARAARAWGDRSESTSLLEARGLYLLGEPAEALDLVLPLGETGGVRDLRDQARDALLADLPWPETLVAAHRIELRSPETVDLVRVVDGGPGAESRLEAFGLRDGRHRPLVLFVVDPGGRPLRSEPLLRLPLGTVQRVRTARLTGGPNLLVWHRRDGRPMLDVLAGVGGGLEAFRFQGEDVPKLAGETLRGSGGPWSWREGRFEGP